MVVERKLWPIFMLRGVHLRKPVRVKGGMSLRNGMWHGLANDIIMRNVIYAGALFWRQWTHKQPFFEVAGSTTMTIKNPGRTPWYSLIPHGRLAICTATKILLAFIGRAAGSTDTTSRKSAIEEKMFWKVSISRSRSLPSSSFHDCDVKVPNFTFCGGRGHKTTSFFSLTLIQSFKTQLQKHLPTFDELIGMESARIHFSSEVFVTVVVA